jgi:NAD(P)-dependent dehydrogenase (short-subunit alcohol dehydrogenase family)
MGVIINISSTPAIGGGGTSAPPSIAKYEVSPISKHTTLDFPCKNIRGHTLTLAIGNISTKTTFDSKTLANRKMAAMENSMTQWRDPGEVATIAASEAKEDVAFVTGKTTVIDGGTVKL